MRAADVIRDRGLSGAAFLIGMAAGLALLSAFGFIDVWRADIFGGDFSAIWAGPRVLVTGGDPYDPATFASASAALGVQESATAVYIYPGWMAVLLAPFGLLDLPTAALLWVTLTLLLSCVGLFALLELRERRHPLVHTILAFTLIGSESGIVAFYSGQTDFLVIGGLALMAAWLLSGRQVPAGIAASAMLVKPQLFVVAVPALLRIALARGDRRFLWSATLSALALTALSTLIVPQWWSAWLAYVPAARAADARAATLPNALKDIFGLGGDAAAYALLGGSIVAAFAFSPRSRAALPVWLMVSMSIAPYMFVYDHVVGIVPLAMATAINGEHSLRRAVVVASLGALILCVAGTLLHAYPGVEYGTLSFNGIAQFGLTVVVTASLWPYRGEENGPTRSGMVA